MFVLSSLIFLLVTYLSLLTFLLFILSLRRRGTTFWWWTVPSFNLTPFLPSFLSFRLLLISLLRPMLVSIVFILLLLLSIILPFSPFLRGLPFSILATSFGVVMPWLISSLISVSVTNVRLVSTLILMTRPWPWSRSLVPLLMPVGLAVLVPVTTMRRWAATAIAFLVVSWVLKLGGHTFITTYNNTKSSQFMNTSYLKSHLFINSLTSSYFTTPVIWLLLANLILFIFLRCSNCEKKSRLWCSKIFSF